MSEKTDSPAAAAIWTPQPADNPGVPQQWARFRRTFTLDAVPETAMLQLFATHRYRLIVNGKSVAHGPSRYEPGMETFDAVDLRPLLKLGENLIEAEAWFCQSNNFQHAPEPTGRFAVVGRAGEVDLATPGEWRAAVPRDRLVRVPDFSFAIGPAEVRDDRAAEPMWGKPAVVGELAVRPRDLPMPTGEVLTPTPVWAADLKTDERRIGFMAMHPTARTTHGRTVNDHAVRYATFLHAEEPRRVTLALHWGPHFFNGGQLKPMDAPARGNRQHVEVELAAGWNLLAGEVRQVRPAYPVLIGVPLDVPMRAAPDHDDANALRFQPSRPIPAEGGWVINPPKTAEDLEGDWQLVPLDDLPPAPAQLMAWDKVAAEKPSRLPLDSTTAAAIAFDFGTEYLGHVRLDVDAPAGTVIDVAYDERRRGDGALNLFGTNPFVQSADRFVSAGGRATFETFHPRGGRYLQVTLRGPGTLHGVTLLDARCLPEMPGAFECPDASLNWAWRVGRETLRASIEDVFCDSPWRERGLYLGDSLVQAASHLCATGDCRTIRRGLQLFAAGRLPDDQLPAVTPGWIGRPHADFSLIYCLWLADHVRRTGDRDLLPMCLPAAVGVLRSPSFVESDDSPLWNASAANHVFIDWGVDRQFRTMDENAVLNAFRIAAVDAVRELGGDVPDSAELRATFAERLWLPEAGRFAGGTMDGEPAADPCLHANILALAFGLGNESQTAAVLTYVTERLLANAKHAEKGVPFDDFCELYFLHFALMGLVRHERFDIAEQIVADHVRPMMEADAPTLWECIHRGVKDQGSTCHSWSAGPMVYAMRHVLGVQEAGSDAVVIEPRTTLDSARGVFPHPRGPIRVSWHRDAAGMHIESDGPPGVSITHRPSPAPGGRGR